jgi:hypothetical protein
MSHGPLRAHPRVGRAEALCMNDVTALLSLMSEVVRAVEGRPVDKKLLDGMKEAMASIAEVAVREEA